MSQQSRLHMLRYKCVVKRIFLRFLRLLKYDHRELVNSYKKLLIVGWWVVWGKHQYSSIVGRPCQYNNLRTLKTFHTVKVILFLQDSLEILIFQIDPVLGNSHFQSWYLVYGFLLFHKTTTKNTSYHLYILYIEREGER